jgi:hypothetical protein
MEAEMLTVMFGELEIELRRDDARVAMVVRNRVVGLQANGTENEALRLARCLTMLGAPAPAAAEAE